MQCSSAANDPINSYALVSYIPDPLGGFLDRLRCELVSSCVAQSHVSILPPRPLEITQERAAAELFETLQSFVPFCLNMTRIEVFQSTSVIYLGIGRGAEELKRLHDRVNLSGLHGPELHQYHPHITLAQDFPPQEMDDMVSLANERWAEFSHRRSLKVECLTFVQNTIGNRWLDLAEFSLGRVLATTR